MKIIDTQHPFFWFSRLRVEKLCRGIEVQEHVLVEGIDKVGQELSFSSPEIPEFGSLFESSDPKKSIDEMRKSINDLMDGMESLF